MIAQVRKRVERGTRRAQTVKIPGALVDHVVLDPEQMMTTDTPFDDIYLGGKPFDPAGVPRVPFGADKVIARILYLGGVPNMQRLSPVRVGEEPIEMHKLDLTLELEAVSRLNHAIQLCLAKSDAGTRELIEHILTDEEDSIDWLEAQLHQLGDMGRENYLAQQLED